MSGERTEQDRLLSALERTSNELREQLVELEALRRARRAAESTNLVRGEILALVGRAMRTPADAILGLTGLLRMGALLPSQRAYVDALQEAVETLRGFLAQVSDFSRLESGTLPLEPIPFDLGVMFEDLVRSLSPRAQAKGLTLRVDTAATMGRKVIGDPGRLRQILMALVEHQFFRLERGDITIECGRARGQDELPVLGSGVVVRVFDNGPPIPQDLLPSLFEPFGRGDLASSREEGLVLPIARQLARLMGGDITVENQSEGGIHFTVRVPLPDLEMSGGTGAVSVVLSEPVPTSVSPGSLVVVEADPVLRLNWAAIGEAAGYRPRAFGTLVEALAELSRREVDVVVFSDHDAESYAEVGRQIRSGEFGRPALIMLPAAGYPGDASRLREAGFRGYLVKPVAPADLREALEILRRTPKSRWGELFITRHSLAESRQGAEGPPGGEPNPAVMELLAE